MKQRLKLVIERQRAPAIVVSHEAVLRALYAYFADRPLKESPPHRDSIAYDNRDTNGSHRSRREKIQTHGLRHICAPR
ncbi:6-phosphofructo-2-kinase/fructose-2,6-bisphosphatase isoform X2 [Helianthus annuus]|uniref:6-phosphofructo-2-kinase/fructose-2, 6-bisphosphatase isoform X2 n=1 Tax=Helianthus annuus TaxID=4232 RepID=UPI00165338E9|nr:6-phosphofructo-2-kinase/fructose-2,6-bisphosphatase isoform X2 [Helianthus annuus]